MSRSTSLRTTTRIATSVATAGLAALLVAAPASARPDPGTGGRDVVTAHNPGSAAQREGAKTAGQGTGAVTSAPVVPQPATIRVDDDAVEYLQVGAGLLAGLSLAGAGAALASRRHHRAHPA